MGAQDRGQTGHLEIFYSYLVFYLTICLYFFVCFSLFLPSSLFPDVSIYSFPPFIPCLFIFSFVMETLFQTLHSQINQCFSFFCYGSCCFDLNILCIRFTILDIYMNKSYLVSFLSDFHFHIIIPDMRTIKEIVIFFVSYRGILALFFKLLFAIVPSYRYET